MLLSAVAVLTSKQCDIAMDFCDTFHRVNLLSCTIL